MPKETVKPREQVQLRIVPSTQMRLEQWVSSPELVKAARKLLDSREFQAMLAVLRNENPHNYGVPVGSNHDDRIAHACQAEGYSLCLNNFEAMGTLVKRPGIIEATFEPEEAPATTKVKDDPYAHRHD